MNIEVSIHTDSHGDKSAQVVIKSTDNQLWACCSLDAVSCRAVALSLMNVAVKLERKIVSIDTLTTCPLCVADSPDFEQRPVFSQGKWVHLSKNGLGHTVSCMSPPKVPPGGSAA